MDNKKITRFGLIRHAETLWNREKKIQGQSDSPLTAEGKIQASLWGQILKQYSWDRIITSDSGRALNTANIINTFLKAPLTIDSRFREQDWGQWTTKTIAQIKIEAPKILAEQEKAGWNFCPPGGESRLEVLGRSHNALIEAATKWPGETILTVTHEGVIKSIIYRLHSRQFLSEEPPIIKSQHLHWLIHDKDGLQLEEVNALMLLEKKLRDGTE